MKALAAIFGWRPWKLFNMADLSERTAPGPRPVQPGRTSSLGASDQRQGAAPTALGPPGPLPGQASSGSHGTATQGPAPVNSVARQSTTPADLESVIHAAAARAGFDLCGIAPVSPSARLAAFPQWIESGRAGAMAYLARRGLDGRYLREDIRAAWPWARSVICLAVLYNTPAPYSVACPGNGWVSRYCWGDDYHDVLRRRLNSLLAELRPAAPADAQFALSVDTAPIVEREAAAAAGLGWIGKNTCLIHPKLGSFLFLAAIVTSLDLAPETPLPDRCGSCTKCLDACPTQALTPYQMDATRCIAYLNLELRGPIPDDLRAPMGRNILGCDICQDVCPWNSPRRAPVTTAPEFQPRPGLVAPDLAELASWDEATWRERFRHSAAKRAKFPAFRRNLALAMGNSGNLEFLPRLQQWASEPGELAEHAAWAIRKIENAQTSLPAGASPDPYAPGHPVSS